MGIRLQDKTALVTGATSNIGRAIVTAFAAVAHMLSSAAAAGSAAPRLSIRSARRAGAVYLALRKAFRKLGVKSRHQLKQHRLQPDAHADTAARGN
jgi:NAD(P)-dependent dehydrogenase (short-subunit alcohol dehydrogenase family)